MPSLFGKDIKELKGVGEKRAKLFHKLGVSTVGALLHFYPRTYENWSEIVSLGQAPQGEISTIKGMVVSPVTEARIRSGMTIYKVRVTDGSQDALLTFFNNRYIKTLLKEGETYLFRGKVEGTFLLRTMSAPEFMPEAQEKAFIPIYPLTEGLTSRIVAKAVENAFSLLPEMVRDPLPDEMRQAYHLCHLRFALENVHFPKSWEELAMARKRLIFEELFILQLSLLRLKNRNSRENTLKIFKDETDDFFSFLPFSPTGAQRRSVKEAVTDMMGRHPMSRLLQGDVGSGKTVVAAALCYCIAKNKMQSALMAPTEILAQQHYRSLSSLLGKAGIEVRLLTGSVKGKQRQAILKELREEKVSLLIGTHALLSEEVEFKKLALVITDEQHRFGVAQRAALSAKGENPHLLVMSATPIPRTLALIIYGDLDVSVLDEMPPGRQKIDTYCIDSAKRLRALRYIRKHIDEGYQGYIICPLIEEGETDMVAVETYTEMLQKQNIFSGCNIGMLHGKMKSQEKERIMAEFAAGKIDILVSTTVVEVGVDVPNAVIMMIENAERYGLSQLHQLRGRVGRGTVKSTCILLSDAKNEDSIARLTVMCKTSDGFKIADEDLRLRGPGDFFGSRQHGLPEFKIANMYSDMETLHTVQRLAVEVLQEDPQLVLPKNKGIAAQVKTLMGKFAQAGLN